MTQAVWARWGKCRKLIKKKYRSCSSNQVKYHMITLRWRHSEWDGVSNHQPHDCLLNSLSGRRSKKTSKPLVTGLCAGNSPGPVTSPHKWPVTRKLFPFDDVIMKSSATNGRSGYMVTQWHRNTRITMCLKLSQFSALSFMQYLGLCKQLAYFSRDDFKNTCTLSSWNRKYGLYTII